jgi:hypothetical protein
MISESEAIELDTKGWIVSSSRENKCGQMKWTHGGVPESFESIEARWRIMCPHWYPD